jgi:hypothetical protein
MLQNTPADLRQLRAELQAEYEAATQAVRNATDTTAVMYWTGRAGGLALALNRLPD